MIQYIKGRSKLPPKPPRERALGARGLTAIRISKHAKAKRPTKNTPK